MTWWLGDDVPVQVINMEVECSNSRPPGTTELTGEEEVGLWITVTATIVITTIVTAIIVVTIIVATVII